MSISIIQHQLKTLYQESVFIVNQKTGLNIGVFPALCPYSLEQLLDKNWLPDVNY